MEKKRTALGLILAVMLTVSGCLFRSPAELYRQPEKSAGYEQLNAAIRQVKNSLGAELGVQVEDAAIMSGDNTNTIQLQDLDGDGRRESALTFLRAPGVEKPMRIYIFTQDEEEAYAVTGVVEGEGSAIYAIDYAQLNGEGRKELVVHWQISSGAYQLGVYTFDELLPRESAAQNGQSSPVQEAVSPPGRAELTAVELLLTRCSVAGDGSSGVRLMDMDQDTRTEVAVTRLDPGGMNSTVELYGWRNGGMRSLASAGLSNGVTALNRIRSNYLAGEYRPPALYVTGTLADNRRIIDVLAWMDGELVNLTLDEAGVSREVIQGYTEVIPTDINDDYVVELPCPTPLPVYGESSSNNFWLIDWSQYDSRGNRNHVLTTYHNVSDGWYLEIPGSWRDQITISRNDQVTGLREVIFSQWRGADREPKPFLSIYRLSTNRTGAGADSSWFILREEENVVYAARFHPGGWNSGLEEMDLLERFKTIQTSWYYE